MYLSCPQTMLYTNQNIVNSLLYMSVCFFHRLVMAANRARRRLLPLDHERPRRVHRIMRDGSNPLEEYSEHQVREKFRFAPEAIYFICGLVEGRLARRSTRGHALPVLYLVLTSLSYLGTGGFMSLVGDRIRVDKSM